MLQAGFDTLYPYRDQWYRPGDLVTTIPDEAIERHLESRNPRDRPVGHAPLPDRRSS
jgi:hypothetical protein